MTPIPAHGPSRFGSGFVVVMTWAPALSGRYLLMSVEYGLGSAWARIGATSTTPNSVAIAPAVLRIRKPSPTARRPISVRYTAAPRMARSAPGVLSVACACVLDWACWPRRNPASVAASETTNTTTENTSAFAISTGLRCGTDAIDERIIPVLYSPVITSTPRTPIANCARNTPRRLTWVASKPMNFAPGPLAFSMWFACTQLNSVPSPSTMTAAASRLYQVERSERSLIHSELDHAELGDPARTQIGPRGKGGRGHQCLPAVAGCASGLPGLLGLPGWPP